MSGYLHIKGSTAKELVDTLQQISEHLKKHPTDKIEVDHLTQLMKNICTQNAHIEKLKQDSCWNTKAGKWVFRIMTGASVVTLLLSISTLTAQYLISKNNDAKNDDCDRDPSEDGIFAFNVAAPIIGTVVGIIGSLYEKKANERQEVIDEINTQAQTSTFNELLEAIKKLNEDHNRKNFDDCIAKLNKIEAQNDFYLSQLGSKERIVSNLIEQSHDPVLQSKIRKAIARAKKYEGERASTHEINNHFKKITQDIKIDLEWLYFRNFYLSCDGRVTDNEEDARRRPSNSEEFQDLPNTYIDRSESLEFKDQPVIIDINQEVPA